MDALRKLAGKAIATFFYVGYSPKAPGTMGSLAALPFAWFLWQAPQPIAWLIFCLVLGIGIWSANVVVENTGVQDNQCIVIDEVLGIFLTTCLCKPNIFQFLLAFLLFRLFDIWKPGPVRWADRKIKGGLGVIVDDLIAALMALGCLIGLYYLLVFLLKFHA